MKQQAEITHQGVFDLQVCVPEDWTDEEVETFVGAMVPCGTTTGWQIRKEGHEALQGDPERMPCEDREDFVHIVLEA